MTPRPDCSIIIVNYNTPGLTLDCLRSVYDSFDGRFRYQVIVVDNASADDSVTRIRKGYPDCRVIASGKNLGFAKGNNLAMKAAEGDYFLLLNSDTIVSAGAIDASLAYLKAHPDAGVVGCRLFYPDGSHQHSLAKLPSVGSVFDEYLRKKVSGWYGESEYAASREVGSVIGAFFLVSRSAVESVGMFDERYFMNVEDVDWCKRMWDAGFKVLYFAGASIIHIGSQSIKSDQRKMNWELHKNRFKYFRKFHGIAGAVTVAVIMTLSFLLDELVILKKRTLGN
jgi:GT2 family glycosyltransferase